MATSTAAAADPREELPVVVVFQRVDSCVTVQWGQDGADHTIVGGLTLSYASSCSALDSNGRVPTVPTFGSLLYCDGGIVTIGETRYRIQVQQEQQQQLFQQQHRTAAMQEFLTRMDHCSLDCSFLTLQYLKDHDLHSYANAATACANQDDVRETLEHLVPSSTTLRDCDASFTAIIAPSGTGKTQHAATAAYKYGDRVRYLLCDASYADFVQEFYVPHKELAILLRDALRDFGRLANQEGSNGANAYRIWFRVSGVVCQLATLLDRILFPNSERPDAKVTFSSIQEKVKNLGEPLLVFLDEIPSTGNSDYSLFISLRDVLRALGISPVLMSTHTGAQNAIVQASDSSSTDADPDWCGLVTRLPRFHTTKPTAEIPYLSPLERPLVASYLSDLGTAETSFDQIVETVQVRLQRKKSSAWTENPTFQLCQLYRAQVDHNATDLTTYQLVGKHFGYMVNPSDYSSGTHRLTRSQALRLGFRVQMVVPSEEPLLFTALTSWSTSSLDPSNPKLFPLVDETRNAISVRRAYQKNSELFQPSVPSANPAALKLNGDLLEILSLASVCLASMNCDRGVGQGILLPHFFACVYHFMQNTDELQADKVPATTKAIQSALNEYATTGKFVDVVMPCCSSTDSPYLEKWKKATANAFQGSLKRRWDDEHRDGWITKQVGARSRMYYTLNAKTMLTV